MAFRHTLGSDYRQNHGRPGVVYILENEGLRAGIYKIGCTRHTGSLRANQLNEDANTGTPGMFRCIFEHRTKDCGKVEELVHKELDAFRRGKWGQEFFEVPVEEIKRVITKVSSNVDNAIKVPAEPLRPLRPLISTEQPEQLHPQRHPFASTVIPTVIGLCVLGLVVWGGARLGDVSKDLIRNGNGIYFVILFPVILIGVNFVSWLFGQDKSQHDVSANAPASEVAISQIASTIPREPLSDADWELIEEVMAEFGGEKQAEEATHIKVSVHPDAVGVSREYHYRLLKKVSVDEARGLGSEYSKWPLLLAEIKDGDELWTYNAQSISPTASFDGIYGLGIVRDGKLAHQLLINAYHNHVCDFD